MGGFCFHAWEGRAGRKVRNLFSLPGFWAEVLNSARLGEIITLAMSINTRPLHAEPLVLTLELLDAFLLAGLTHTLVCLPPKFILFLPPKFVLFGQL